MKAAIAIIIFTIFSTHHSLPVEDKEASFPVEDDDDEILEFPDYNSPTVGNANQYLDKTLSNAKPAFISQNLDPMSVPGFERSFDTKLLGLFPITVTLTSKAGRLRGLSTIHRTGDATLSTEDGFLIAKSELGVRNLTYLAECSIKFIFPFNLREMSATIDYLSAYLELSLPMDKEFQPKATDFEIRNVGRVDVAFSKNGWPLDAIYGAVVSRVINGIKDTVKDSARPHILGAMNRGLTNLKFSKTK